MNLSYLVKNAGVYPFRLNGSYVLACSDEYDGYFISYKVKEREAYSELYDMFWNWRRDQALNRDGYKCVICGNGNSLSVDHIKSRGAGGTDELENLRCLCAACHAKRHNG